MAHRLSGCVLIRFLLRDYTLQGLLFQGYMLRIPPLCEYVLHYRGTELILRRYMSRIYMLRWQHIIRPYIKWLDTSWKLNNEHSPVTGFRI